MKKGNIACPDCSGSGWDMETGTNCCGAQFYPPGWPDNDMCMDCKEHTEPAECELCSGTGEIDDPEYVKKIREERDLFLQTLKEIDSAMDDSTIEVKQGSLWHLAIKKVLKDSGNDK